jgi:carboxypeptidase C (cathepsin A)
MSRNPYLKVWVVCGHYDLATPYFAAQYNVNQMELDPTIRDNIRLTYYESGHMVYIYKPALEKLKADFITFVKDATMADAAAVPSAEP